MNIVHLQPELVPSEWKLGYTGRKFQANICNKLTISDADLRWGEGSRRQFFIIDGAAVREVLPATSWPNCGEQTIQLHPGIIVVERHTFCGKDMGVVIYACPQDVNPSLFAPVEELSEHEKFVLYATRSLKASYGGQTRFQMFNQTLRCYGRSELSQQEWDATVKLLKSKKLLNARGAITVDGKNAVSNFCL
jgi:hypothetical protein